jgi:hypothetical protein
MKYFLIPLVLLCATSCQNEQRSLEQPMEEATVEATGNWKITSADRKNLSFELDPDGTATRHHSGSQDEGAWETLGDQVWIFWSDGWIDLIEPEADGYTVSSFGPGTALDATPDRTARAERS